MMQSSQRAQQKLEGGGLIWGPDCHLSIEAKHERHEQQQAARRSLLLHPGTGCCCCCCFVRGFGCAL